MYFATANDRIWELWVWGRFGNCLNRMIPIAIFRHTEAEAIAYVTGLGYEVIR